MVALIAPTLVLQFTRWDDPPIKKYIVYIRGLVMFLGPVRATLVFDQF
jgi:hypothetical protein